MSSLAPDIKIDLNLYNPGQFFACCGALELAGRLWPGSEGWFERRKNRASFCITTHSGHNDPLSEIVRRLCEPEVLVRLADDHEAYAQEDRKPVIIEPFQIRLDWWLNSYRSGDKSELKVWAGQQTPMRNINGLRSAWREILRGRAEEIASPALFGHYWPMKGRFGFDPSASWEALDVGFSPDEQDVPVQTSPATEILAAIGLQRCRPMASENARRRFVYRSWATPLEIAVAPAALVGAVQGTSAYEFRVVMRNAQYGAFGWAKPAEERNEHLG